MKTDTRYKLTLDGDGVNGFPSGEHLLLDNPEVLAFLEAGGVIEPAQTEEEKKSAHNADITSRIEKLEAKQFRAEREAILTGDKTRLQEIEDKIADLRSKLR